MAKRPGVITFIGFILVLQAAFGAVAALTLIFTRNNADVVAAAGASSSELLTAGLVLLVVAAIGLLVGLGILGGSRVARVIVAIVQVLNVMSAAWLMFTHHSGAFLFSGLINVGISAFVLWALYNDKSDAYYES